MNNANSVRIHPTAIVEADVELGAGTSVWDSVHIRRGARLGDQCIVGEKTYIAYDVRIGHRVKLNAMVYICYGVTIEDGVMISAGTVFTNDAFPRATTPDLRELRGSDPDDETRLTLVAEGATIGAGCTIGSDLRIGRFAMVGMGSVVTRDVPDFHLVVGNPAVNRRCLPVRASDRPLAGRPARGSGGRLPQVSAAISDSRGAGRRTSRTGDNLHTVAYRSAFMTGAESKPSLRWGVVGGGMLGLTVAHRLAQAGQRVTVLEAAPEIGGLAAAWELGGVTWDKHYHVTLLSDTHLRGLLAELGIDEHMRWVETKTGFYTDGRLHSMSNTLEFLRFPPLRLIDKLRLGATIFAASRRRNWKPLEWVLVADWLRKWSGERTFQKIWLPLLQAKLGECYRRTSAAFIWATIQRMYAARRTGLKKEMFGYAPGGYANVLRRFAGVLAAESVEVRTIAPVRRVAAEEDGAVRVDAFDGAHVFDRVVLTCPSPIVLRLCPQLGEAERRRHEGIEYLGIVCASVLMDRKLADFYVTNITDDGAPFTAVIEMTALVDPSELGGNALVYLPRYAAAGDAAWAWTDAEVEERFLAALERMYPAFRREHVRAFRVSRVKHVMALPTIGYSESLPSLSTGVPNVFAVNSAHIVKGTLNVNEVIALANESFESVLAPSIRAPAPNSGADPGGLEASEIPPLAPPCQGGGILEDHVEAVGELVARP